jgi:integrase
MPTLFKRSNGIYYISYLHNGKRRWKSTGESDRRLAMRALEQLDRSPAPRRHSPLLSEFRTELLASIRATFTPGTVLIYELALKRLQECLGDLPLQEISVRHVDLYKSRRAPEVSPVTLNIELRTFRAAFNRALSWELIERSPFAGVTQMRVPSTQPLHLSREGFTALLKVIDEDWFRDLVTIAVCTGLRRGELLNVQWADIDFEHNSLLVQSSGDFRTKFGKRRLLPINATVSAILASTPFEKRTGYVFNDHGKKLLESTITHKFKCYVRKAGIDNRLHFHSLRHTFATWLVKSGVNLYEVQKLLGHSSIKVTEVYAHLVPNELHACVGKIELI